MKGSIMWHWLACALLAAPSATWAAAGRKQSAPAAPPARAAQPAHTNVDTDATDPSACAFDAALDQFNQGQLTLAAGLFYRFLHAEAQRDAAQASVDINQSETPAAHDEDEAPVPADALVTASNVAWAHFFLGECLERLELYHAASVYYYEVVKQASEPELVPRALGHLKDMAQRRPLDSRLVYDNLLDAIQFSNLPSELADWVEFEQGLRDIQRGFDNWGNRHLANIDPNSPWAAYADYIRATRFVRDGQDPNASVLFDAVANSAHATADVAQMGQLALARLHFGHGDFADALHAYAKVRPKHLSFEEGLVLTEKAWTHYYLGHIAEALGALHALSAPSYENFFYPDMFLLRALIYKDRCYLLGAKDVVRSFRSKFAHTFEQLRARVPQERIERIRRAAVMQGTLAKRTHLLLNLSDERDRTSSILSVSGGKLVAHVTSLYETAIDDNDQIWRRAFERAADDVSLRLLDTQEQMNVLDYEVSLAIFKPVEDIDTRQLDGKAKPGDADKLDPRMQAIYPFDGEYWNDELADYQVMLPDRCLGDSP